MRLTVKMVRQLEEPGRYGDGEGLYLHVRKGGSKQWVLRSTINKRRVDIGLGSANVFSPAEARDRARDLQKQIKSGRDPLLERKRADSVPSFEEAARKVWESKRRSWKNAAFTRQWIQSLEDYAFPVFGAWKVNLIESHHVLQVLSPIWLEKQETARRVRQRLRMVFDWARVSGYREAGNPVDGVELALPKQVKKIKHHKALPWRDVPDFMAALDKREGVSALALKFLILTAARSGEVREATWAEIDFNEALWVVAPERMKMNREHRVPLSPQALAILKQAEGFDDIYIFPSPKPGVPMSNMVFAALLKRIGHGDLTTHGFRSSFRDWCSDEANADWAVAEAALAHRVGNKTERAYARSDLLERRRKLMGEWASFATH